jgi:hypothetical protein
MADLIQVRRDIAANWTSADPILAQGEIGYETDTTLLKIGDGTTVWTLLGYTLSNNVDVGTVDGQSLRWEDSTSTWEATSDLAVSDAGVTTATSLVATTADINGGTFDGVVGGTTPAAGDFTVLTASTGYDGVVGGVTPADGSFTTLSATTSVTIPDGGLISGTNTAAYFLVADGASYTPVLMSGDASMDSAGVVTLLGGEAESLVQDAKVAEAGGIVKGQLVYISGATGGFPTVLIADNSSSNFEKSDTIGIAFTGGSLNQTIRITLEGDVTGLDTSTFTEGDDLYLGTSGAIVNVHPSGIDAVVRVGHAIKINATTGSIFFQITNLTPVDTFDGIVRHQLVNESNGTGASAAYTIVNDLGHRSSISMVGSGFVVSGLPIEESLVIYSEGYNNTYNVVDGNYGFEWWTDVTDSHNLSATMKMGLSAAGDLTVVGDGDFATIGVTGTITGPSGVWDVGGMDLATTDNYSIAGTTVLDATTLGAGVLASSLTSLGTIASLVATTADINAGTVDAVLGGTTPAAATVSSLVVTDDSIQVDTAKTPGSATATGTTGQIAWDSSYIYVCISTDVWRRVLHATW